jgi:uncharacterized protein YndB with AHSA1/START domain
MSVVRKAVIVMGVLFGLFIIGGLLLPSQIQVQRGIDIGAPPEEVFPLVDDLRAFNRWSPWAGIDSATRYEFSGPESGVGARLSWSSENPEVGFGTQEIVASNPPEQVDLRLDFGPQGTARTHFYLAPVDTGTGVTWSFEYGIGNDLIGRYKGLIMSRMVGAKYEEGLSRLKALAETGRVE